MNRAVTLDGPLDLVATLRPLSHHAPTMRFGRREVWRATRTPDGAATVRVVQTGTTRVDAEAWGPGAAFALEHVPALVGVGDDPLGFAPAHPLVRDLHRRAGGIRLPRSPAVAEALVPVILEQKVQTAEAQASYRRVVTLPSLAERAPGPLPLWLPPDLHALARTPYFAFHRCGVEKRRTDTVRRAALCARRLDEVGDDPAAAYARMRAIPGIGPWSAAQVGLRALGDPDAVPVGDYHFPHLVAWALAGEPRADDARMLELLDPFRPHRGRVITLLARAGIRAPRYGPRLPRSLLNPLESGRPARV